MSAIRETSFLPRIVSQHPEARAVLDRYGMTGCGGPLGPAESVGFFARMHGVPVDTLMEELNQAVADSGRGGPDTPSEPIAPFGAAASAAGAATDASASARLRDVQPPLPLAALARVTSAKTPLADVIYRPFFLAALLILFSAGATYGVVLLASIGASESFTSSSIYHVNAHGHAQIFGWVGLFVMGFALQAFPRFLQTRLACPRLAVAAFVLMVTGIGLRVVGEFLIPTDSNALGVALSGSALEIVAVACFLITLITTKLRSTQRPPAMFPYVISAFFWFALMTLADAAHVALLGTAGSTAELIDRVATFQAPLRDIQIHGFALLIILGVSQHLLPRAFGFGEVPVRRSRIALVMLNAAIVLELATFLAFRLTHDLVWAGAMYGAFLMLAIAVVMVAWPLRLIRGGNRDRSVKFIRAAYAWLFISLLMLLLMPVWTRIVDQSFPHAYFGATRHAITVGFVSMMIVGVGAKVIPTLGGVDGARLPHLWIVFILLNVGCALRVVMQCATDLTPAAFQIIAVSGALEVTALLLWAWHLVPMLRSRWLERVRQKQARAIETTGASLPAV